ncbi:hypothetical protein [Alteromonas sp. 009811495]|uniref:hypothetical protein n=1 Tax=Alteromonas sp. 009811495 TaxID=3002962 RepID=UPI00237D7A8C|nr:hypothetical protein [Alteromonas sp. 009811495]WDT86167.1 hypothetical protein OZ660_00025 [Alteromonas sp. 009811495]
MRYGLLLITALLALGCTEKSSLTESERRYNHAINEQNQIIIKANDYLNSNISGNITADITHLIYAKEQLSNAKQVLIKAKIVGIKSPEVNLLSDRLSEYDLVAATEAMRLIELAIEKTIQFRRAVDDMPLVPLSGASLESDHMIKYMGQEYNGELNACCISTLKDIEVFLRGSDQDTYWSLRKHILNLEMSLSRFLEDDKFKVDYERSIEELSTSIEKLKDLSVERNQ